MNRWRRSQQGVVGGNLGVSGKLLATEVDFGGEHEIGQVGRAEGDAVLNQLTAQQEDTVQATRGNVPKSPRSLWKGDSDNYTNVARRSGAGESLSEETLSGECITLTSRDGVFALNLQMSKVKRKCGLCRAL